MSDANDSLIVNQWEAGERLDKILATRFKEHYSRTYFQYLIENGLVFLNEIPQKKRIKVKEGDEIEIRFASLPEISISPENIPLTILYEDDHLLAINKPAGMVIHPAPGNWSGTFVNALLFHCSTLNVSDNLRPGIVHRLDKETSGILLAAKSLEMQQKLIELFASRKIYKEYMAISIGNPQEGMISEPIGRHPVNRKQMAVIPNGKPAITHVHLIEKKGPLNLLKIVIATGRTHQIRVHLKFKGAPVLGDCTYGNPADNQKFGAKRQMLHAALLKFQHPITGQNLELKAPFPEDFLFFVEKLSKKIFF